MLMDIQMNPTSTPGPVKSILVKVFPTVKIYVSQSPREAYVAQCYMMHMQAQ